MGLIDVWCVRAILAGKLLTGAFFYPFYTVMPLLLASHRWPGFGPFFRDMTSNRNGFWSAVVRLSLSSLRADEMTM